MKMGHHFRWLALIAVLTIFCIWVALPNTKITNIPENCYTEFLKRDVPPQGLHLDFNDDCSPDVELNVTQALGLDLVGGLRVLLQAELPTTAYSVDDLRQTANNVTRRVNALGVGEATVQVQGRDRILVELPGVHDPQQAIDTIQKTALLEFVDFGGLGGQVSQFIGRKVLTTQQVLIQQQHQSTDTITNEGTPEATAEATAVSVSAEATVEATAQAAATEPPSSPEEQALLNPATGQPFQTVITGAGLKAAVAGLNQQGEWEIRFELTSEGASVFGPFTGSRVGQPMAIVLDGVVLSAPTIRSQLDNGGVIVGSFTEEAAKQLALQLRSGALPIPLRVESAESIGATLGQESVNLSIRAGIIGVIIVLSFMLIYYRVPGIAADLALLVFIALNMAVFKLVPVTLTLPAIVGFLISIGTAVDGNILIFERIKEEIRAGTDLDKALVTGFDRAWNSIRDSNLSTIIICAILFLFGQTPGASIVSGFAVTLALGLLLNLFTAVIVTRTFLHLFVVPMRQSLTNRTWLLGV